MRLLTHFTSRFLRIIGSLRSWSSLTSFSASLELFNIHLMDLCTEAIPGEEQVNVNAVEAEFEDRNAGGGNRTDVGHLVSQPKHLCK